MPAAARCRKGRCPCAGTSFDGAAPKVFSRPAPEGTVDVALCTTASADAVVATHPEAGPEDKPNDAPA